jgi:small subunit ribosomal protein S20
VADHASSKKRIRQTLKRSLRNRHIRATVRSRVRALRQAIQTGNADEARKALAVATRRIDMAVSKGVFHRKTGSRYISRLTAQVAGL